MLEWFGTEQELVRGDINRDGSINVLDVIQCVNIILDIYDPTPSEYVRADCNGDRRIDVTDVIGFVNLILGIGSCPP
ncbi:MAG: dockerin type I repeat-containing protein [bacterium]